MLRKPLSIEDTGLEVFLNSTRDKHNGYGYDDFIKNKDKLNKAALAALFGMKRKSIYRWLEVYQKENQSED